MGKAASNVTIRPWREYARSPSMRPYPLAGSALAWYETCYAAS